MLLIQSTTLPAINVLEQEKIYLKKYCENENLVSAGSRRLVASDREKVFQQIIEHVRANDEEQITLKDLKKTHGFFSKGRSLYYKMD